MTSGRDISSVKDPSVWDTWLRCSSILQILASSKAEWCPDRGLVLVLCSTPCSNGNMYHSWISGRSSDSWRVGEDSGLKPALAGSWLAFQTFHCFRNLREFIVFQVQCVFVAESCCSYGSSGCPPWENNTGIQRSCASHTISWAVWRIR